MKKLLLFSLFALLASAMGWATTETWTKVTSTPDSWDGDYLIVYEAGNLAFNGSLDKLDAPQNNTKDFTRTDNTITTNDCKFYFTIEKVKEGADKGVGFYTIKSFSGIYVGCTSTSKMNESSSILYYNDLSIDGSGNAVIAGVKTDGKTLSTAVLRYNKASSNTGERFRYYAKGQEAIALYKKQEGPATKVAPLEISPAFGDIAKGTQVTISCATEGAVLNGMIGDTNVTNAALPYTFTASVVGDLKVNVKATKEGLEDSDVRTGTYNVYQPKVAALKITPAIGTTIEVGTEITISCATEGAVLNGTIGETTLTDEALPYTFTASEIGDLKVNVKATKEGFDDSEVLDNSFTVKAAAKVAYKDVITEAVIETKTVYQSVDYNTKEPIGALYNVCALATNGYLQFNDKKASESKPIYTGIVMKTSQAAASKLIITWNNKSSKSFEVYGKNTPYISTADLYGDNPGNLIETVAYSSDGPTTVDLGGKYTYIGIKSAGNGASYVTSFEFIWNEGAAGGADVTYTKASEAKAGNFAVLATAEGKAIGRNSELNPVAVAVSDDAIALLKGQPDIDEFEIVENGDNYQLCGGLASNSSRRYLTYDATGVTTVTTADVNADVTFESATVGLLVKFNDGEYLMFNGTKFVKGEYAEVATQAEGEETLVPVIVFLSSSNVSTGVETVEIDENAAVQYFNLNGVQVKAENLTPGLYIVRQGNKVSKQVIR